MSLFTSVAVCMKDGDERRQAIGDGCESTVCMGVPDEALESSDDGGS